MMKSVLVSCFLLLGSVSSAAFTGSDFTSQCSGEGAQSEAFCNGVLQAYLHIIEDKNICYRLPEGTTHDEVRETTLSFMQTHPSASRISASILVTQAIITNYPCHIR